MFGTLRCVIVVLLFVLLRNSVLALRREFPTCRSSDTCIRLTECVPYMNLIKSLRKPLTRSAVVFLRRQECGFDGLYPMVCCFPSNPRWAQGDSMNDQRFTTKPSTHTPSYYNVQMKPEQTYRLPSKPDFTPSDLSDYRSYKAKTPTFSSMNPTMFKVPSKETRAETTTLKSTTEKVKTSTWFYNRKTNNIFREENIGREDNSDDVFGDDDYVDRAATTESIMFVQNEERYDEKAEETKRKMEALNHAFMFSSMDYFFVRRMGDQDKTNNLR